MRLLFVLLFAIINMAAFAQFKMTRQEYIAKYKDIAIEHMQKYGIPASIKLAQAIIESGGGASKLAIEANNHFGIKCGTGWQGETIAHDDDLKGECFRKYKSAEESFVDHSVFLSTKIRYAALFKLDIADYVGWANGLKAAGYATAPHYATIIVKVIEDNNLHEYDKIVNKKVHPDKISTLETQKKVTLDKKGRERGVNNGVKYVVSKSGDSFATIAHDEKLSLDKLFKYNDLDKIIPLKEGVAVYIQGKKGKYSQAAYHTVQDGETIHSISQKYGIKEKSLKRMNPKFKSNNPKIGVKLRLN